MTTAMWIVVFVSMGLTAVLTGLFRKYALLQQLLDHPNERSAHKAPIPRGGGIAIVAVTSSAIVLGAVAGWISPRLAAALVVGGLAIAVIGAVDDRKSVRARTRFFVHVAAAGWALLCLQGMPTLRFGAQVLHLGLAGSVIAVVGVAWMTNLFNFMDGIDGIAASEAVFCGAAGALLVSTTSSGIAFAALIVAASSAGFLWWNWSPARIFMGDVASGYLGYAFGVIGLASERTGSNVPLLVWGILFLVFEFDATACLFRRMAAGEVWHGAHRKHAYQRLLDVGWSHERIVTGVLILNALLVCIAFGVVRLRVSLPAGVGAAVALLAAVYLLVERVSPMSGRVVKRD